MFIARIHALCISLALGKYLADCGGGECLANTDDNQLLSFHRKSFSRKEVGKASHSTAHLLTEMRNLAHKVTKGEDKISDATQEVLNGIDDQMDTILNDTATWHENDQEEADAQRDAIQLCANTTNRAHTQNGGINDMQTTMGSKLNEHNTCRVQQKSDMTDTTTDCNDFQTFWSTLSPPACLTAFPGGSQATAFSCLQEVAAWQQTANRTFTTKKKSCDDETKILAATTTQCDTDQVAFESSVCTYAEKLVDTCTEQEDCRTNAIAARAEAHGRLEVNEKARENEFVAATKIKCYLQVLRLRATGAAQTAKLAECESLNPDHIDAGLKMVYHPIPAAAACDTSPVQETPCSESWLHTAYGSQSWYNAESQNTYTSVTERVAPRECNPCSPSTTVAPPVLVTEPPVTVTQPPAGPPPGVTFVSSDDDGKKVWLVALPTDMTEKVCQSHMTTACESVGLKVACSISTVGTSGRHATNQEIGCDELNVGHTGDKWFRYQLGETDCTKTGDQHYQCPLWSGPPGAQGPTWTAYKNGNGCNDCAIHGGSWCYHGSLVDGNGYAVCVGEPQSN
jgi:hypothetical protein